jgi:hypothetical protein
MPLWVKSAILAVGTAVLVKGAVSEVSPLSMASRSTVERSDDRPWWEKSNCLGLKGVSWGECQKAISQNKRDRKAGRRPSNAAWWEESKCLGLTGLSWSTCQKGRSEAKRSPRIGGDPWVRGKCLGLEGLPFVECQNDRKRYGWNR